MNAALEKRIKRQIIGKPHRFLAIVPLGFEQTLVDELEAIRLETRAQSVEGSCAVQSAELPHVTGDGKVEFTAKITEAWKVVAYSRIANRALMHIADFKAENFREFEKKASEIPFELYLATNHQPLTTIHVTCKHSRLYHSDAIAERLQKIICKTFPSLGPSTPALHASAQDDKIAKHQSKAFTPLKASETSDLNTRTSKRSDLTPQASYPQHLYVTLIDDRCTIWLDLAGEELYKRGHERFVNDAPLKETIAAAMLFEAIHLAQKQEILRLQASPSAQDDTSERTQATPSHISHSALHITLFDPMAGSGTFSLEAAYISNKLIPGVCRDFALKHQPTFKETTWNYILRRETRDEGRENSNSAIAQNAKSKNLNIVTSDISERAVEIIKHNVECSPLASTEAKPIQPKLKDFFSYTAKEIAEICGDTSPIIVLNPPYGKRLDFDAPKLYTKIGHKLTELARDLKHFGKELTVAILAPKDDSRPGNPYTCTANLLHECPALSPEHNANAKHIVTSHGGITLNVFITKLKSI